MKTDRLESFENIFDFLRSECVDECYEDDYESVREGLERIALIESLEKALGVKVERLFDYEWDPFSKYEIEKEGDCLMFHGSGFDGKYEKEQFLFLIKDLVSAYSKMWGNGGNK